MSTLKLNRLNSNKIDAKKANKIRGGVDCCCCGCNYEGTQGGSSSADNASANKDLGIRTRNQNAYLMWCPGVGWNWVTPS